MTYEQLAQRLESWMSKVDAERVDFEEEKFWAQRDELTADILKLPKKEGLRLVEFMAKKAEQFKERSDDKADKQLDESTEKLRDAVNKKKK